MCQIYILFACAHARVKGNCRQNNCMQFISYTKIAKF